MAPRDQSVSWSPVPIRVPLPLLAYPQDSSGLGCSRSWGRYPPSSAPGEPESAWDFSSPSGHRTAGSPQCARVPVWELIPATSARLFAIPGVSGCGEGMAGCTGDTCAWGGWRVPELPVQGSACARRLLWQVCACTPVSSVANTVPGGDKCHWGPQRAPQLWDLGTQWVEVGVLAGIYQSWCGHVQSSPKGEMLGEGRGVSASLPMRIISQGNEAAEKREQKGAVGLGGGNDTLPLI